MPLIPQTSVLVMLDKTLAAKSHSSQHYAVQQPRKQLAMQPTVPSVQRMTWQKPKNTTTCQQQPEAEGNDC
jgi:hypothetical protein